ncbi:DUF2290 domain-containing protein [Glycomyces sp. MUSA5-2]|uniref:DUF2290 domain-containing protein n=1 Tax=Glycomyces sp. MUSA5-2 TaxID=2053002 RepID=UPI0030099317
MADPRVARSIHKELNELIGELVELGMVDDQNFASLRRGPGGSWTVDQGGAPMSLSLKKRPYDHIYRDLESARSYAMRLLDGALLQFSYEGISEQVVRHRLAYLPSPRLESFQNNPDLYIRELHFVEIVGHQVVPVPIRLDYDNRDGVAVDVVHPAAHLTMGQYQHCRVPVSRPASPSEFTEFIIQSFYSTPAMDPVSLRQHVSGLPRTITDAESEKIYIAMPGTTSS